MRAQHQMIVNRVRKSLLLVLVFSSDYGVFAIKHGEWKYIEARDQLGLCLRTKVQLRTSSKGNHII